MMMMKGSTEALVVHDHQQVDEHGGEQQADAEIAEAPIHALDLARDRIVLPGASCFCRSATTA